MLVKKLVNASLLIMIVSFTTDVFAAADIYKFDPNHTYVEWSVSHFGFSDVGGKFMANGNLAFDVNAPQNSKVTINVDTAHANTGIPELDDILTGKNFFDTTEYPDAKFVSDKIIVTSKTSGRIYGTVTIRGVSKPIILDAKLNTMGIHPYYKTKAVGFSADATLKRSAFGMRGYLPGVGDDVKLHIQAEAEISSNTGANT